MAVAAALLGRLPHAAAHGASSARAPTRPGPSSAPRSRNSIATASTAASRLPRTGRDSPPAFVISSSRARSNLALDGPLGIGGLRVGLEGEDIAHRHQPRREARWRRPRATSSSDDSGSRCRSTELRWWLLGIPAPGEAEHQSGCGQRRDPRLHAERLARQHQLARAGPGICAAAAADGRARRRAPEAAGRKLAAVSARCRPGPAPAKLNLMLHIVGRRAGRLPRAADRLSAHRPVRSHRNHGRATDGSITRPAGPAGVPESEDLVVRAARALQQASGTPAWGRKSPSRRAFPWAAGLGGGSSDAATTLVALEPDVAVGLTSRANRGNWRQVGRRCTRFRGWTLRLGRRDRRTGSRR